METIDSLAFDEASLPAALRPLSRTYRRFAVADDVDRERLIEEATPNELAELVQAARCNPSERFAGAD